MKDSKMMPKIFFNKTILISMLLIFFNMQDAISQESINGKDKKSGAFVTLSMGPLQSSIKNEEFQPISEIVTSKRISYFGSIEFGYYFSDYFELSTGIGYSLYNSQLSLKAYGSKFNTKDSEDEPIELRVSGWDIKEAQKIGSINIPVSISVRLPLLKSTGLFFQPGVNVSFPITKNFNSTGRFTYKAYYPSYNILLENLPFYGFPSNLYIESEGNLEIKQFYLNAICTVGFDFSLQEKFKIIVAAFYNTSLSGITDYGSNTNFQLSSNPDQINSIMGGCKKATTQSFGLKISLRYYLQ